LVPTGTFVGATINGTGTILFTNTTTSTSGVCTITFQAGQLSNGGTVSSSTATVHSQLQTPNAFTLTQFTAAWSGNNLNVAFTTVTNFTTVSTFNFTVDVPQTITYINGGSVSTAANVAVTTTKLF
jgi:hypothetical protein